MFTYVIINHDVKQQAKDLITADIMTYGLELDVTMFQLEVTDGTTNYWAEPLNVMQEHIDILNDAGYVHYSGKHETIEDAISSANLTLV